jgi:vacuolar-type H+-ATPase subunit H
MSLTAPCTNGQTPITSISLRSDQIGLVKTAQALSTRISFPEPVKEIICGDLYDPASGRGSFVVQRAENDVFIKPVVDKGMSNLFVKTGERSEKVYNFDLSIVSAAEAVRVMNVVSAADGPDSGTDGADQRKASGIKEAARAEADEIVRKAKAEADKILADAEQQARGRDRDAESSAQKEIERRFIDAMMLGIRESKLNNSRIMIKKVAIMLDPHVLTFSEKSYVRYTIQNTGNSDFRFAELGLEDGSGSRVNVEITQNKPENKVRTGESITGIIAFDPKAVANKGRVTLFVKGTDQSEVARLAFMQ